MHAPPGEQRAAPGEVDGVADGEGVGVDDAPGLGFAGPGLVEVRGAGVVLEPLGAGAVPEEEPLPGPRSRSCGSVLPQAVAKAMSGRTKVRKEGS